MCVGGGGGGGGGIIGVFAVVRISFPSYTVSKI